MSCIFNQHVCYSAGEFSGVLLGDRGHACTPFLLTPNSEPGTEAERAFNHAHTKTRAWIEMTFGQLKSRFYIHIIRFPHFFQEKLRLTNLSLFELLQVPVPERSEGFS